MLGARRSKEVTKNYIMKKLIQLFPPFKSHQISEVEKIFKQIYGDTKHSCEIIIVHDCKNPDCPAGILHGVIGTDEDEIMAVNFAMDQIDKEERELTLVMKDLMSIPESEVRHLEKNN